MSQISMTHFASARLTGHGAGWSHLAETLRVMVRTWITRRSLSELTSRELADIGVSRAAALAEARRLPWDVTPLQHRF